MGAVGSKKRVPLPWSAGPISRWRSTWRPVLYETTRKFLQLHGLWSLRELPWVEGLSPPEAKG